MTNMNNDLLNILSNDDKEFDNQKLVEYLNGNLSEKEKHEVEEIISGNDFMADAVEGLERIRDKKNIPLSVEQLNKSLHAQIEKKKTRRDKRSLREYPWIYITIILVLSICIIGYLVIRLYYQ